MIGPTFRHSRFMQADLEELEKEKPPSPVLSMGKLTQHFGALGNSELLTSWAEVVEAFSWSVHVAKARKDRLDSLTQAESAAIVDPKDVQ